ncbi:phosphopantetheine-binding protein [Paenibacillus sp. FSL K6-3166]|jgi:acyl carrier protein|uniref:Carrier domain-containing protein n=1 Tax=Paenibacillus pseudetheri TaxID=2897682 RepID=A0ABN8FSS5_9BACL|nr:MULTISPECIES: phosphopantetheine-binding protein [Paenibacillus]OZQ85461.1 hypothetical protein CA598_20830 [Paenibacillus sp. VTT E-133291]CAH1058186.1 hypothetical protein PAECIP111894_04359 [Paenibacillus pseudetheri]
MKTLEEQICEMIVTKLELEDVDPNAIDYETPLFSAYDEDGSGLELDSVDSLELVVAMRETFGIVVGEANMSIFKNINSLSNFVREKQAALN